MRIFVFGISGQLHVCANSEEQAGAVAAAYQESVKTFIGIDESLEASDDILGCAIHVADKPKATVTVGRKAVQKLARQRDWVDELEAQNAEPNGHGTKDKPPRSRKPKATTSVETEQPAL